MFRTRTRRLLLLACLSVLVLVGSLGAGVGRAQESGGSFGGSAWDDEPSGGGGGGSSSYGGGGGGSSDWGAQAEREREREEDERREREERERREREERERREREEREAAERAAAERARKLALPPAERVAALAWPATPAVPSVSSPRVAPLDAPLASAAPTESHWSALGAPASLTGAVIVYGPWNVIGGTFCSLPFTLGFVVVALLLSRSRARSAAPTPLRGGPAGPAMRLSIAFDWTARAALQAELAAMAKRFDMRTRPGLSEGARAIAALLRQHAGAARYVSWELSTGDARTWFQTRANDLRARFRAELVRNDATSAASSFTAHENEGQGLVVVSVVVAGKRPITPPVAAFSLASLGAAIDAIAARPTGETLALEVIWSPAAENDRMSSYELEKLYPELQRVTEGVGARQCLYCKGPFPTELGKCPACGAPIPVG